MDLTSCRGSRYESEGPIPWTAMMEWADRRMLDDDQRESLEYLAAKMDEAYLNHKAKKLSERIKTATPRKNR